MTEPPMDWEAYCEDKARFMATRYGVTAWTIEQLWELVDKMRGDGDISRYYYETLAELLPAREPSPDSTPDAE